MGSNSGDARIKPRAQTSACSFDVFDTFLLRACASSQGVYERAFQLSPVSKNHPRAVQAFVQHRVQADNQARPKAKEKRDSFEVTIEEIYGYFPFRLFDLDRTSLQDLVDAEFQAELDLCRINDEVLRLYQNAQNAGQRVGFISDTYWNEQQLATLLRNNKPDLTWDFLYASCEYGTSKSEKLFARYLKGQRIDPASSTHIGDNPIADIKTAHKHGIHGRFYPQASLAFTSILERESSTFNLLCDNPFGLLDNGYRTLRRIVTARAPERSPAFQLGTTVLGPAMMGFDAFLSDRIARLRQRSEKVAVAFLGRDGFLSHRVWTQQRDDKAAFLEISRRVTLIGSATTLDPLIDLFNKIGEERINATIFFDILKCLPDKVAQFFAKQPGQRITGYELAKALPFLVKSKQIADIAATVRTALLSYLESQIPDLRQLSDLVVIDIGYSGSIQKSLRQIFDIEGLNTQIHGLYLSTHDDAFYNLALDDTAEGFISDLVFTPHVKRMFNRSATIIEQVCCSATGSVRSYGEQNLVQYEPDGRSPEQIATSAEVQTGALAFIQSANEACQQHRLDPFVDLDVAARWAATTLARLVLMPTERELAMIGAFMHDLNLGSQAIVPMVDSQFVSNLEIARGLPLACTAPAPPMWLAGSFANLSAAHGYLYMLFGANRLPVELFSAVKCGTLQIGLFQRNGAASMESIKFYRNSTSDLRIPIPVASSMNIETVAIPLAKIVQEGLLRGITVQYGKTVRDAAASTEVKVLPSDQAVMAGFDIRGSHFLANDADGCLLLRLAPPPTPIMILTIALTPLNPTRFPATDDAYEFEDELKTALFNSSALTF